MPPLCLTLCEHQGAALGKDASSTDSTKVEIRSTRRETTTTRRSHSARTTECCQTQNGCTTITALDNQLVVRGGPPAVVAAATANGKPQTIASLDLKQAPESQCPPGSTLSARRRISPPAASPFPNGPMPTVLSANVSATQEKQPTLLDAFTGNQNYWFTVKRTVQNPGQENGRLTDWLLKNLKHIEDKFYRNIHEYKEF